LVSITPARAYEAKQQTRQVRSWRPVDPQMRRGRVAVNVRIGVVIKENLREGDFRGVILVANYKEQKPSRLFRSFF
jgi:hypothetical protein